MGLISRVSSRTYRDTMGRIIHCLAIDAATISAQGQQGKMMNSVPFANHAALKRAANYWTLNSLGYHGGLGKLFKEKAKRSGGATNELNSILQEAMSKVMMQRMIESEC